MSEKWTALSLSETEKKLNTSAASGLSRKAARARLQKIGENNFFQSSHAAPVDCVREVIMQPSIILLIVLGLLLIFFKQPLYGGIFLTFTVLYILFLVVADVWSGRVLRVPAKAMIPPVRVIREGQMFLLHYSKLVPGDLIELEHGDIAPCDIRLVTADRVRVLDYLGDRKGEAQYIRSLKSAADEVSVSTENDISTHINMIYGGSVIESGSIKGLVVEAGMHTYIGALQGGYFIRSGQSCPKTAKRIRKAVAVLQVGLLLATIPLVFLCLLIGKNAESLPLLFSSLLCTCLANPAGNMDTVLKLGQAIGIYRAYAAKGNGDTALIKTDKETDRLSDIDVLFLLGSQAFSYYPEHESETASRSVSRGEQESEIHKQELKLAMSEAFLAGREDCLRQLKELGITPIIFLETESSRSVTYIIRSALISSRSQIALASRFRAEDRKITSGWGKYLAYCGFSNEELRELMITLQKSGKKVGLLGNSPEEYAALKQADVSFACVDDISVYTDSDRERERSPMVSRGREDVATQRMRQKADVLIPCASRRYGGISSILHTLHTAEDTARNLTDMTRYLLYTLLLRAVMLLPSMLIGLYTVPPLRILFSGLFVDLFFVWLFLTRVSHEPTPNTSKRYLFGGTVTEAIAAGVLTLIAFLFIYYNTSGQASDGNAYYLSLLSMQTTAFLVQWDMSDSLKRGHNRRNLLIVGICFVLFCLLGGILGWLTPLGIAQKIAAPYSYLLLIGPIAVILSALVMKLYQYGRYH